MCRYLSSWLLHIAAAVCEVRLWQLQQLCGGHDLRGVLGWQDQCVRSFHLSHLSFRSNGSLGWQLQLPHVNQYIFVFNLRRDIDWRVIQSRADNASRLQSHGGAHAASLCVQADDHGG